MCVGVGPSVSLVPSCRGSGRLRAADREAGKRRREEEEEEEENSDVFDTNATHNLDFPFSNFLKRSS